MNNYIWGLAIRDPAIADVAVFGTPDERKGEVVIAALCQNRYFFY